MAQVVVEDERAHPQVRRGVGGRDERRQRSDALVKVVCRQEQGEAEICSLRARPRQPARLWMVAAWRLKRNGRSITFSSTSASRVRL